MKVRGGTMADAVAVRAVVERSFGAGEGRIINSALSELDARGLTQNFFVAVVDDLGVEQVVGVVGLSRAWVDARQSLAEVLLLSPLAVLPERRGQRIGESLMASCVAYGEEVGAPLIVLEGDPAYYRDRGWDGAVEHGIEPPSCRIPASAFHVRLLKAYEKWMVGRVVYPDSWWRHDVVGLRDPLLTEVEALHRAGSRVSPEH